MPSALILILSVALFAGCSLPPSDACAGWGPIYMAPATPEWLNANDRPALVSILTANEFGAKIGCWQ